MSLIETCRRLLPGQPDEVARGVPEAVTVLGPLLGDIAWTHIARAHPELVPLRRSASTRAADAEALVAALATQARVSRGHAVEMLHVVAGELSRALVDVSEPFVPGVDAKLRAFFVVDDARPVTTTARHPRHARADAERSLAGAHPGARESLASGRPRGAQSGSVVDDGNPHASRKISSGRR